MKLYRFNPPNYGEQAFVIAESKEKAIEALQNSKTENQDFCTDADHQNLIFQMTNGSYTIDEFEIGEVVFAEIS